MAKAKKTTEGGKRLHWFDEKTREPLLDDYATKLDSFMQTMADGKVEEAEIKAQESRLVGLMKELEPLLDDALHEKVTRLLCEITAYDMMQLLHSIQQARPKSVFRG